VGLTLGAILIEARCTAFIEGSRLVGLAVSRWAVTGPVRGS